MEKEMYRTCTVVEFNGRMYGITVTSDAKGAKEQAEQAALKLGVAMGDQQEMEKAAKALTPEQQHHLDILMKLRARTTSKHAGEADNANRLLKKKLGELSDVSEVKNLLDMTINASRASRYNSNTWDAGSSCNKVQVCFIGEKICYDFFLRLCRYAGNAYSVYYFHGKRYWDEERFVQLGFSGHLPLALDAAMLMITTADLAFDYVVEVPHKKWEAMSGFMEGVAETAAYDYDDMHRKLIKDAEANAKLWFGVKAGAKRKRPSSGEVFEQARQAGARAGHKVRKTLKLEN